MSRKWLVVLLLLIVLMVATGVWGLWGQLLWVIQGAQTLDKDQLELWEKWRDLVWPVLVAVGLGIGWLVRRLWSKAASDSKPPLAPFPDKGRAGEGFLPKDQNPIFMVKLTSRK